MATAEPPCIEGLCQVAEDPWATPEDRAVREQIADYRARAKAHRATRTCQGMADADFYDRLADAAEALEHMHRLSYGGL